MFLEKPDENEMLCLNLDEIFENMSKLIPEKSKKEDVYVLITREKTRFLKQFPKFISSRDYSELEKEVYHKDIGKIECEKCIFRFTYHNNVFINSVSNIGNMF